MPRKRFAVVRTRRACFEVMREPTPEIINHSVMAIRASEFSRDRALALSQAPPFAIKSKAAARRRVCHPPADGRAKTKRDVKRKKGRLRWQAAQV